MIARDELAAWLRLLETPGVGRESARKLLAAFGSPESIFAAGRDAWEQVASPKLAGLLETPAPELDARIDAAWSWLMAEAAEARHIVTLGDPRYPASLLETADPPLLLYAQGRIELLRTPSMAIVGSRNPTPQGLENARAFSASLSRAGITVVSGMALGIDGAAHDGALEGEGSTVAIVGTGLDRVYPRRHLQLAHHIAKEGLIISEYSLGTMPLNPHFPQRNRIIAGLSKGTLVVEAAVQSGSLITAKQALEAGREVFAIPGSIHSPLSRGCHWLIKQGAKLVESAQDILEELRFDAPAAVESASHSPNDDEDPLLGALGYEPASMDALVARTGCSAAELSARLLEHELLGRVSRLPGQIFQRVGLS